jgi:hypothetical protein
MMQYAGDRFVERLESRFGRGAAALWIGLGLMAVAAVYARPAVSTISLGNLYAEMAKDPFTLIPGNYVGFRILTPLISYLLGFRGQLIIVTNLLIATSLLVVVFLYFRKTIPNPGDALKGTVVMAFSLVTLTTIYFGGYTDSLTYLIVFLMWLNRKRPWLYYSLFMIGVVNRESLLFLVPWFIFLRWQERRRLWPTLIEGGLGFFVALGCYDLIRLWIAHQGDVTFRVMYYLEPLRADWAHWIKRAYPHWGLGLFSVFKLFWIIPMLAVIDMWRNDKRAEAASMALVFAGVAAQLIVAFDSSRMFTLAFPVMVIALQHMLTTDAFEFRRWFAPLILLNLLVPQLYTAAHIVTIMHSIPGKLMLMYLSASEGW